MFLHVARSLLLFVGPKNITVNDFFRKMDMRSHWDELKQRGHLFMALVPYAIHNPFAKQGAHFFDRIVAGFCSAGQLHGG